MPKQVSEPNAVVASASMATRFVLKLVFMCLLTHLEIKSSENIPPNPVFGLLAWGLLSILMIFRYLMDVPDDLVLRIITRRKEK